MKKLEYIAKGFHNKEEWDCLKGLITQIEKNPRYKDNEKWNFLEGLMVQAGISDYNAEKMKLIYYYKSVKYSTSSEDIKFKKENKQLVDKYSNEYRKNYSEIKWKY